MNLSDQFLQILHDLPDFFVYVLLGVSAFIENVFPPIPGDTITAFGAFLVGIGRLDFFGVYFSTTLGSLLGFLCLFQFGRFLGKRFFIEKDYRFFKAKDIVKAESWFGRYGYLLIAFNRFLPGVRSAISIASGISGLRLFLVALLALLSCAVWNLIWIFMGYSMGSNWETIKETMSTIMMRYNAAVILFLLIAAALYFFFRKKRKEP